MGKIRLIKIDVEGFEADVLSGAKEVLEELRPDAILFETNETTDSTITENPVIKILCEKGYGFFTIPKCLVRMGLKPFDPNKANSMSGHDLLASPKGKCYDTIAKLVKACA